MIWLGWRKQKKSAVSGAGIRRAAAKRKAAAGGGSAAAAGREKPGFLGVRERHGAYSVRKQDSWAYRDRGLQVRNPFVPVVENMPHLVLRDSENIPRFTLGYSRGLRGSDSINVVSIQRERTQYELRPGESYWSSKLETEKSKEFQKELGMHPAEFLLSEFIFRHRAEIRRGVPVFLFQIARRPISANPKYREIYRPLIDRFFRLHRGRHAAEFGKALYELSPAKRRVREILAAP